MSTHRNTPRMCICTRGMGVKKVGSEWVCQQCLDADLKRQQPRPGQGRGRRKERGL